MRSPSWLHTFLPAAGEETGDKGRGEGVPVPLQVIQNQSVFSICLRFGEV